MTGAICLYYMHSHAGIPNVCRQHWLLRSVGLKQPEQCSGHPQRLSGNGKLSNLTVTPANNQVTVQGNVYLNLYPLVTQNEVLSNAAIDFQVPTLGYRGHISLKLHRAPTAPP